MGKPPYYRLFLSCLLIVSVFACASTEENLKRKLEVGKRFYKGATYLKNGELRNARAELLAALEIDASIPKIHNALGRVYLAETNFDQAEKEFKEAIKIDERFFDAYVNLGSMYMLQKKWDDAILSFEELLKHDPVFPSYKTNNYLGWAFYEKADFDQAFLALRKAIISNPKYMPAHYNMGLTFFALGFEDKAVGEFKKSVALSPGFLPARNQLGLIYLRKKMFDLALPEFRMVISKTQDEKAKKAAEEYVKIIEEIKKEKRK